MKEKLKNISLCPVCGEGGLVSIEKHIIRKAKNEIWQYQLNDIYHKPHYDYYKYNTFAISSIRKWKKAEVKKEKKEKK